MEARTREGSLSVASLNWKKVLSIALQIAKNINKSHKYFILFF